MGRKIFDNQVEIIVDALFVEVIVIDDGEEILIGFIVRRGPVDMFNPFGQRRDCLNLFFETGCVSREMGV